MDCELLVLECMEFLLLDGANEAKFSLNLGLPMDIDEGVCVVAFISIP